MEVVLFLLLGVAVGLMGSLLGVGGGLIVVPVLVFAADYDPQLAVGTSVFVILLNGISGSWGYLRQGRVCLDAAVRFSLATIPGAFLGSYASEYLRGNLFYAVFGVFFVLAAVNMYRKAKKTGGNSASAQMPTSYNWQLGVICSIFVGFLATVLGIGGGIVHVPMMVYVLGFPVHIAIATSTLILAVSALAGVVSHAFLGHIVWLTAVAIGVGAVVGAQLGVRAAERLKSSALMQMASVLVLVTGIKFLMNCF